MGSSSSPFSHIDDFQNPYTTTDAMNRNHKLYSYPKSACRRPRPESPMPCQLAPYTEIKVARGCTQGPCPMSVNFAQLCSLIPSPSPHVKGPRTVVPDSWVFKYWDTHAHTPTQL